MELIITSRFNIAESIAILTIGIAMLVNAKTTSCQHKLRHSMDNCVQTLCVGARSSKPRSGVAVTDRLQHMCLILGFPQDWKPGSLDH